VKYNKYKNKKTTVDNIVFDSKREAGRYGELKILQLSGVIKDLKLQPKFLLCKGVRWNGRKQRDRYYVADFYYIENGQQVVEDSKGFRTDVYKLKRSIFLSMYPQYRFIET